MDAVGSITPDDEVEPPALRARPAGPAVAPLPFGSLVAEGLQAVNEGLLASQRDLQGLALGETRNLHEVLVRLEESRISFQLMLQVRNRVLEAYQDVIRMQV